MHIYKLGSWLMTCSTSSEGFDYHAIGPDSAWYQTSVGTEGKVSMESHRQFRSAFLSAACLYFVTVMNVFSLAAIRAPASRHRVKITGPIVMRQGNVLQILDEKDGSVHGFKITDKTAIRCDKGFLHGNTVMDASALVPALTVEVEGIAKPKDMTEARMVKFNSDTFAFAVVQEGTRDLCSYSPHNFVLSWVLPE